jgi:hypothetical protein
MLVQWYIGIPPIHQFFFDVKLMRLTATDPTDGTDLMEVNGGGPVGDVLNGGGLCGALFDGTHTLTAGGTEAQGMVNLISGLTTLPRNTSVLHVSHSHHICPCIRHRTGLVDRKVCSPALCTFACFPSLALVI